VGADSDPGAGRGRHALRTDVGDPAAAARDARARHDLEQRLVEPPRIPRDLAEVGVEIDGDAGDRGGAHAGPARS
jgi:hypothetical protein